MPNITFHTKHIFSALLLFLVFGIQAFSKDIKQCDLLIQNGIDAMWEKDHVKSLELLTEARTLAEKNHWYKQLFLATNNIGANYYNLLDYGEALNYYLESYTIAVKHLEPKYEMIVLNNIAILYSKKKDFEKANEYFKKAYDIAVENKDEVKIGLYAMNLGNVANETNNLKKARDYFNESLPLLKSNPQFEILAKMAIAENDLLQKNYNQAQVTAETLLKTTKDLNYHDIGISLLMILSKSNFEQNNLDLASDYAQKIFARKPNLETKVAVFKLLSDINQKKMHFDLALQFKDSIIKAERELNEINNGRAFENNRVKFEIENYKKEIALNEAQLSNERKIFYSVLAIIIIVVFFVILTLRNLSVKHKQKKLIAERNEQIISLELEKKKSDNLLLEKMISEKETASLLEHEKLKNEIEQKNRKLSAKALYLSGRNELIEETLQSLSKLPEISNNNLLTNHIQTLKSHLKTDAEWDSFITHFEEVNQTFLNNLKTKHPKLNANDIRFITYIYMNLSTKEISSMLNITAEACRKRKERIANRMELSSEIPLYDYLSTL
ncbi:tetratricopeptide repeat protein [Flavobacterium macacae]|uniref:Tetratricopeptide repeat protein n=1 Tax=Flavobacterium macacae TaxID=2488993 RepID=A0A3P3WFM9_9FLAO|nr:tetratricopeptide repeat protein [Flavobacterium macacae]RRJ93925.1 tetratricopeptide repeat protein [Flavobacterium macacae]